jgi:hypothetical protein
MGSATSVRKSNYEDNSNTDTPDNLDSTTESTATNSSIPQWFRRKSTTRRPSIPENDILENFVEPVRSALLNVPTFDKHPFAEYRFNRKLGE